MVKNIRVKQIYTSSLAAEPLLQRTKNGELLCLCERDRRDVLFFDVELQDV